MNAPPYSLQLPTTAHEAAAFASWLLNTSRAQEKVAVAVRDEYLSFATTREVWIVERGTPAFVVLLAVLRQQAIDIPQVTFVARDLYDELIRLSAFLAPEYEMSPQEMYRHLAPLFDGDLHSAARVGGWPAPTITDNLANDVYATVLHEEQYALGAPKYYHSLSLPFAKLQAEAVVFDSPVPSWYVTYCMTPETPVLTADLRWVPMGSLQVGDRLLGFEENATAISPRHWDWSTVTGTGRIGAPLYEVTFDDGSSFRCTGEHPWLLRRGKWHETLRWVTTAEMFAALRHKGGPRRTFWAPRYFQPWESETDYDDGFLAAAFDGEGSVTIDRGAVKNLTLAQKPNGFLEKIKGALCRKGFTFSQRTADEHPNMHGVDRLILRGGFARAAELLGRAQPPRLLEKWLRGTPSSLQMETKTPVRVASVTEVGWGEVITLETDTHTYIAGGFPVHNTHLWLRVVAHFTGEPILKAAFMDERSPYAALSKTLECDAETARALLAWQIYGRDMHILQQSMPDVIEALPTDLPAWGVRLDKRVPAFCAGISSMQQSYWQARKLSTRYGRLLRPGAPLGMGSAFMIFGTVEDIVINASVTFWQNRTSPDILVSRFSGGPASDAIRIGGSCPESGRDQWSYMLRELAPLNSPLNSGPLRPQVLEV